MIPERYAPRSLSWSDRVKQLKSIREGTDRPKVDYPHKRSKWVARFEARYGHKITDSSFIAKSILSKKGQDEILAKGKAAYYTSGSRPNVTATQWAYARLASVILGGKARNIDKSIWDKYRKT